MNRTHISRSKPNGFTGSDYASEVHSSDVATPTSSSRRLPPGNEAHGGLLFAREARGEAYAGSRQLMPWVIDLTYRTLETNGLGTP